MDHHYPYATRTRHKKDADNNDNYPIFPPPNVVLHPDDATSKVFLAVARAFISVDNRAMTIKDIAERAGHYGLICQNLSAAAQAVTTYLRQHKARCDQQDDHPLLLSHTLSGTLADDDLVPALYSRSGGDSHPLSQNRLTNFRKGTAVWYLSRATGVPCPFARAGIRLCDYVTEEPSTLHREEPRISSRRQKLLALSTQPDNDKEDRICGQKRKRPLRGCVAKKDKESSENDERPPKVKLTLRLKPLLVKSTPPSETCTLGSSAQNPIDVPNQDSDSSNSADEDSLPVDSSSSSDEDDESLQSQADTPSSKRRKGGTEAQEEEPWSLPPYPRRSISIPCYTPSVESSYFSTYDLPPSKYRDPFRRSPSVPFSVATPPPESEDELDSFHVTMKMMKHISEQHGDEDEEDDLGWEADLDSEGEGETMFETPGPRSPSAPLVKEEPRDVQGMLDAWEGFDSNVAERSKAEDENRTIKVEVPDSWNWDKSDAGLPWNSEDTAGIKQEDFGLFDSLLNPLPTPLSPISSLSSHFSSFSWSDTSSPPQEAMTDNQEEKKRNFSTIRPRARTVPSPFAQPSLTSSKSNSPFSPPSAPSVRHSLSSGSSNSSKSSVSPPSAPLPSTVLVSLLQSMSMNGTYPISTSIASAPQPCVSPLQTRCVPSPSTGAPPAEKVVVHTCQPCHPAITATHMEDIPVFQMMLGPFQLLRRIDSDFVNLSPIIAYSGTAGIPTSTTTTSDNDISEHADKGRPSSQHSSVAVPPSPSPLNVVMNATVITSGSPEICGTWVTLAAAQAYVRDHLSSGENGIARRALELFLSDTLVERFPSALQDFHRLNAGLRALNQFGKHFESTLMVAGGGRIGVLDCAVKISGRSEESTGVAMATSIFTDGLVQSEGRDVPLSKTEQDLFHELCDFPPDGEGKEESGEDMMVVDSEGKENICVALLTAAMEVDNVPLSILPTTPTTAKPEDVGFLRSGSPSVIRAAPIPVPVSAPARRPLHTKKGSISSISSLSSDSDAMTHSTSTVMARAVKSPSKEKSDGRPLRRSKRVADMAAAQPQSSSSGVPPSTRATRARKSVSNSRNSLS